MTSALTRSRHQVRAIQRPHSLLAVVTWEFRRFRASRLFWLQALGFFVFVLVSLWLGLQPSAFTLFGSVSGFVAGTSAWGLLQYLPIGVVLLLGLLLPFVNADGVARDLQRRTHELVMTTVLPSWAYVWGRYLVGLLMSLGLAMLMLAAILGTGTIFHLTITDYPAPDIGNVLILWVGMVVSATILLSSVSFASFGLSSAFSLSVLGSFGFSSCSLQAGLTSAICSFKQSLTFLPAAFASLQNFAFSSLQAFLAKATLAVAGTRKAIMTNATSCFMPIDSNSSDG
jgi:ABC-type transport system involved in multi-copper enzyme maturation permease subunit